MLASADSLGGFSPRDVWPARLRRQEIVSKANKDITNNTANAH